MTAAGGWNFFLRPSQRLPLVGGRGSQAVKINGANITTMKQRSAMTMMMPQSPRLSMSKGIILVVTMSMFTYAANREKTAAGKIRKGFLNPLAARVRHRSSHHESPNTMAHIAIKRMRVMVKNLKPELTCCTLKQMNAIKRQSSLSQVKWLTPMRRCNL